LFLRDLTRSKHVSLERAFQNDPKWGAGCSRFALPERLEVVDDDGGASGCPGSSAQPESADLAVSSPREIELKFAAQRDVGVVQIQDDFARRTLIRLTYGEARWSQGLADWIGCHVNALTFFGGVTRQVVCLRIPVIMNGQTVPS
jgi:hypothetical protein